MAAHGFGKVNAVAFAEQKRGCRQICHERAHALQEVEPIGRSQFQLKTGSVKCTETCKCKMYPATKQIWFCDNERHESNRKLFDF